MKNELKEIDINYRQIEKQIEKYDLTFLNKSSREVEEKINFPPFVEKFYDFIKEWERIPKQSEFVEYYLDKNCDEPSIKDLDEKRTLDLKARLMRSYPSYVRDLHLGKMLESKLEIGEVVINSNIDIEEGVDILIRYYNREYCICLFVNTDRASYFRKKKLERQNERDCDYIELPLSSYAHKEVGDFYLYSNNDIINLLDKIISK